MKIGLDIDGVLGDWDKHAQELLKKEFRYRVAPIAQGTDKLIYPSPSWDHIQNVVSPEAWEWLWAPERSWDLFRLIPKHEGAIAAVQMLSEIGDIVIITSRPAAASYVTFLWLAEFCSPIKTFHLIGHNEKKSSFTMCNVFLDDRPKNYEDLSIPGTKPFLWSRPHNMDFKCSNRITKWSNFIGEVLKVRDGR